MLAKERNRPPRSSATSASTPRSTSKPVSCTSRPSHSWPLTCARYTSAIRSVTRMNKCRRSLRSAMVPISSSHSATARSA